MCSASIFFLRKVSALKRNTGYEPWPFPFVLSKIFRLCKYNPDCIKCGHNQSAHATEGRYCQTFPADEDWPIAVYKDALSG
jgi:hypothetical protein